MELACRSGNITLVEIEATLADCTNHSVNTESDDSTQSVYRPMTLRNVMSRRTHESSVITYVTLLNVASSLLLVEF